MSTVDVIDSQKYRVLLSGGLKRLEEKCDQINKLNVFPVPDGDTGDNMLLTLQSGLAETVSDGDLRILCEAISKGMLYGARGNSGVILSRFFYGMNSYIAEYGDTITVEACISGMEQGVKEAYDAVADPKEGTILTVMNETTEAIKNSGASDFTELFQTAITTAAESLKKTPELLEVLRSAGVVDSGGAGFLCILEGMKHALENDTVYAVSSAGKSAVRELTEDEELLGYCTEFILQLMGDRSFSLDELKVFLNDIGNSVVAFQNGNIVKVHVHTFKPEEVLAKAHAYGEFLTLKIENMSVQHSESSVSDEFLDAKPKRKYGMVAVACGAGIKKMLTDGGCSVVIDGGKSMNPSAKDILAGIRQAEAETVFFFPNNKNIFLAAKQARDMCDFCRVDIIGSEEIGQCYRALSLFDDKLSPDELVKLFESAIEVENTIYVARATRAYTSDDIEIDEGDCLCYNRNRVLAADPSEEAAVRKLYEGYDVLPDVSVILYGEHKSEEEAHRLERMLTDTFIDTEFIVVNGGQPIYDYIFIDEV